MWLEELAPHAPTDQYWHNRTGEDNADAHLKRNATLSLARDGPPREALVVAVTNGRLDDRALLTRTFGTWERIFQGQAEWLARESRRPAAEVGVGRDHR